MARLINHIIGFEIIRAASLEMKWNVDMSKLSRIWTNGCIIRSQLMEEFIDIFQTGEQHLLLHSEIEKKLNMNSSALRVVVSQAIAAGIPLPVHSACCNYQSSLQRTNTGARLIAAQRDYFGAHGFEATDDSTGTLHHFNWTAT